MTIGLALFYFYAAIAIVGAVGMVVARNLIHAVLSLFASLLAVGAIYLLLGSQFLAAMQLFIYGGAVTVLMLFVVMLTRAAAPERPGDFTRLTRPVSLGACIVFFLSLASVVVNARWPIAPAFLHDTASLATILFSRYVLPFEIAGLALTVALIGAIVLARDDRPPAPPAQGTGAGDLSSRAVGATASRPATDGGAFSFERWRLDRSGGGQA